MRPALRRIVLAVWLGASAPPLLAQATPELAEGEIRRIDKEAQKLTIRHGEIKNLDMPPMTMVFKVQDSGLLDKAKVGDKVRFHVEKQATGYVLTVLQPAP